MWYLDYWVDGQSQMVPTCDVVGLLKGSGAVAADGGVSLTMPDQPEGFIADVFIYADLAGEGLSHVALEPLASESLYRLLYRLMGLGNAILYTPDAAYPITRCDDTARHLPDGMADALGPPRATVGEEDFVRLLTAWY